MLPACHLGSLGTHARCAVSRVAGALGVRDCRLNHQDIVAEAEVWPTDDSDIKNGTCQDTSNM